MSQPIDIPSRSKSVPRANYKIHLQVHSDSQVTYHSLSYRKSYGERVLSDGERVLSDDDSGSCDFGEMGTFESARKQKRKKSVKLSRSKRISRSFAAASGVNAEKAALSELRRSSNPAEYRKGKHFFYIYIFFFMVFVYLFFAKCALKKPYYEFLNKK